MRVMIKGRERRRDERDNRETARRQQGRCDCGVASYAKLLKLLNLLNLPLTPQLRTTLSVLTVADRPNNIAN